MTGRARRAATCQAASRLREFDVPYRIVKSKPDRLANCSSAKSSRYRIIVPITMLCYENLLTRTRLALDSAWGAGEGDIAFSPSLVASCNPSSMQVSNQVCQSCESRNTEDVQGQARGNFDTSPQQPSDSHIAYYLCIHPQLSCERKARPSTSGCDSAVSGLVYVPRVTCDGNQPSL